VAAPLLDGPEPARGADAAELPIEIRLVRYALRPMALVHCPTAVAVRLRTAAVESGLSAVLSPWQFTPVRDRKSHGYVNTVRNMCPADGDPASWRGLLVSADARYVATGWLSLYYGWDGLLGSLLGYPRCCVAAFAPSWQRAVADFRGEVGDVLVRAHPPGAPILLAHPVANIFARHFGYHLSEHFPCGFDCAETARLGARLLAGLEFFEPRTARELIQVLAAPTCRHRDGETFLFPDGQVGSDGVLTYRQVWASDPTSATSRQVSAGGSLAPGADWWLLHSATAA
jgi:hypothetical protein